MHLTYGKLPSKAQFMTEWTYAVGDPEYATMFLDLKGVDAEAADLPKSPYGAAGHYDADEVWDLVKALTRAHNRGGKLADARGSLASAILSVLGIEWV